jgi:4-aminobutyrate aminotransferase-like enzyme
VHPLRHLAHAFARVATGRHKTISLWDSFHGASLDAISIGGEAAGVDEVGGGEDGAVEGVDIEVVDDGEACAFGCGDDAETHIRRHCFHGVDRSVGSLRR